MDFGDAVCAGDGNWKPSCLTSGGYAIGIEKEKEKKRKEDKLIIVEINLEHLKFKLLVPFACLK